MGDGIEEIKIGFNALDQIQGSRCSGITCLILNRLRYASSVRPIRRRPPISYGLWWDKSGKRSPPEADEHLPEVCAAS
jgi:hypothetical protein